MKNPEYKILEKLEIKWFNSVYKSNKKGNNNYINFEEYLIIGDLKKK